MKILITGATGFAGGYLLVYLSNIFGIQNVHGTGRSLSKAKNYLLKVLLLKLVIWQTLNL